MKRQFNAVLLTAALSGLMGGTALAANAATPAAPANSNTSTNLQFNSTTMTAKAGLRYTSSTKLPKHSCKGKNDCKGQGGCKSGDNGCKGKNSCKGKGGCATDGSPMPKFA